MRIRVGVRVRINVSASAIEGEVERVIESGGNGEIERERWGQRYT